MSNRHREVFVEPLGENFFLVGTIYYFTRRGYTLTVQVEQRQEGMRSMDLWSGKRLKLMDAPRFNAKTLQSLALPEPAILDPIKAQVIAEHEQQKGIFDR